MRNNKHIGSSLEDFLQSNDITEDVEAMAARKAFALQVAQAIERRQMSKAEMARKMKTTRAVVDRMLDPDNPSLTFKTAAKATAALGMKLKLELVEA